jgi:hypothetical protein
MHKNLQCHSYFHPSILCHKIRKSKQLCYHKQVTQYIFRVNEGDSKSSKSPSILLMPLQIARLPKFLYKRILQSVIPLQYQSQLFMEKMVQSYCKKDTPSIEGHSPFSEPTESNGLMDVWVLRQSTSARLQQVFSTGRKYKLDNGSMGALAYMQGHGRGIGVVATRSQHTVI